MTELRRPGFFALKNEHRLAALNLIELARRRASFEKRPTMFADGLFDGSGAVNAGINAGRSSGYLVDTSGANARAAKPTAATAITNGPQTLGTNGTGYNGYTVRQLIAAGVLSTSGSKVRLTLTPPSALSAVVDGMYIGQKAASGNAWDFSATPTAITVGGSASFTIPSGGGNVLTDWITFSLDETKDYIVSWHHPSTSSNAYTTGLGANYNSYQKAAVSEAASLTPSGYTAASGTLNFVSQIDVQTGVNNMTVSSTLQTLQSSANALYCVAEVDFSIEGSVSDLFIKGSTDNWAHNAQLAPTLFSAQGQDGHSVVEAFITGLTAGTIYGAEINMGSKNVPLYGFAVEAVTL